MCTNYTTHLLLLVLSISEQSRSKSRQTKGEKWSKVQFVTRGGTEEKTSCGLKIETTLQDKETEI